MVLPNTPEMFEMHYAVPMAGGCLGTINTRLDAGTVANILKHSSCKVLVVDTEFAPSVSEALAMLEADGGPTPQVVDVCDLAGRGSEALSGRFGEAE